MHFKCDEITNIISCNLALFKIIHKYKSLIFSRSRTLCRSKNFKSMSQISHTQVPKQEYDMSISKIVEQVVRPSGGTMKNALCNSRSSSVWHMQRRPFVARHL